MRFLAGKLSELLNLTDQIFYVLKHSVHAF